MLTPEENERLTRVGPGTPMGALLRRYWHPVAASSQLLFAGTRLAHLLGAVRRLAASVSVVALAALAACGPMPQAPGIEKGRTGTTERAPASTLLVAVAAEPKTIAAGASPGSGTTVATSVRVFNAMLDLLDDRAVPRPYLAQALPALNTETWQVFADGRMETRYTLKPGLTWHDGTPLSAEDFAFAWEVDTTPELGINTVAPLSQIEMVTALDDRTVVIRWRRLYPEASVTQSGGHLVGLAALPRHILRPPFESAQQDGRWPVFSSLGYWTRDFIGLGPFRLDRWEPGSFIEGSAFDGHALGRPKFGHLKISFVTDVRAGLAAVLSGEVQLAADQSIEFQQGLELKRMASETIKVISSAQAWTGIAVQFRPDVVLPKATQDVRVRRALAYGLDKGAVNEAVYQGEGIPAETYFAPSTSYYSTIAATIPRYPYDLQSAERLMAEAGFPRGTDGMFAGTEGHLTLELKTTGGPRNELERSAVASTWRQGGFDVQEAVVPAALAQDGQTVSTFSALFHFSVGLGEPALLGAFSSSGIPGPNNRWTGNNRGGWSNPEFDRLLADFNSTLDQEERIRQRIAMAQKVGDQQPSIPLAYRINSIAHLTTLRGLPQTSSPGSTGIFSWNIHEWVGTP